MARFALIAWPLPGSIAAVLTLAERLRADGHEACVISIPDAEEMVTKSGTRFEPVLAEIIPKGFLVDLRLRFANLSVLKRFSETRRWIRRWEKLIEDLLAQRNRAIDDLLTRVAPDLIVISSDVPHLAIVAVIAQRQGVPSAYVTPLFNHYRSAGNPPLNSRFGPDGTATSRLRVRAMWVRHSVISRLRAALIHALDLDLNAGKILRRLGDVDQDGKSRLMWNSFISPLAPLPEFFLSSSALDLPCPLPDHAHRISFQPAGDRLNTDFPWHALAPGRKLIYCSLGTLLYLSLERQRAVLQAVIDAVADRSGCQLVLSIGDYVASEDLDLTRGDALVQSFVPQRALLERCDLMITHGGANSMHDSAAAGVPMIVLPISFDQPGCAARAVHHGIGLHLAIGSVTASSIGALIDKVGANQDMTKAAKRMAAKIAAETGHSEGLRALIDMAKRP